MKTATISEAKETLGALIDEVKGGETVVITEGGIPVAHLVTAVAEAAENDGAWMERLERKGIISRPTRGPLTEEELPRFDPAAPPSGVVDALLAEREESW